jgi:hypothetical protein
MITGKKKEKREAPPGDRVEHARRGLSTGKAMVLEGFSSQLLPSPSFA